MRLGLPSRSALSGAAERLARRPAARARAPRRRRTRGRYFVDTRSSRESSTRSRERRRRRRRRRRARLERFAGKASPRRRRRQGCCRWPSRSAPALSRSYRRRRGPHEHGKREAHGKRDAPGGPGALRCTVVDTLVASWGHRAQAMHCHYGCTLQFEQFGVMQRFRRPGQPRAAWCSVQRVTVLSVAQKMAALLARVRLRTR